jgi:uncharacterized protein HemX
MKKTQNAMMILILLLLTCCIAMSIAVAVMHKRNNNLRDDIQQAYREELQKRRNKSEQAIHLLEVQMKKRDEQLKNEHRIREELREELRTLEREINTVTDEIDTMGSNDLLDELRSICAAIDADQ